MDPLPDTSLNNWNLKLLALYGTEAALWKRSPEDFPYQKYPPNALLALRGGDDDHTDPDACTPNRRRFRRGGDDDYTDPDAVHNERKIQPV